MSSPSRRRVLRAAAGTAATAGVAGCLGALGPDYHVESGATVYHPASERRVANGIHARPDATYYACLTGDRAPALVGPDATDGAHPLRQRETDDPARVFHLVVQVRRPRANPVRVVPTGVALDGWRSVRVDAALQSTDDVSVDAPEVVATGTWTVTPRGSWPPTTGSLVLPDGSTVPVEDRWGAAETT